MYEPVKIDFTGDALAHIKGHLHTRVQALTDGTRQLFQTKLPEWRRLYEARPLEQNRQFPFENASNLVVPIIGIHCDTLHAGIMASIWKTKPIFYSKLYGTYEKDMDPIRQAWEDWLVFEALEPDELDLYTTESEWIAEIIRYGTSTLKVCNTQRYDDYFQPAGDSNSTANGNFIRKVKYDGPLPQKLAYQDFLIPENVAKWQHADIKIHIARLTHYDLLQRKQYGMYDTAAVDAILADPDRRSPDYVTKQRQEDADARTSSQGYAEWDIHECWLNWKTNDNNFTPRIICWYHFKSNTLMRAVYDFYPDQPFIMGRLLYRDDSVRGYGLCETLGQFQEEIAVIHNQRRDNQTVATTKVWRVDPNSKLHEGYKVYPGAMLPAEDGEIEPLAQGEVSALSIEEEQLTLDLAERRSGVSPPQQGFGAGTQGKRGVYSAAGTMSLLQEGNRRSDDTNADIRYAHARLGQILSRQYAFLGLDAKKLKFFGQQADLIKEAADLVKAGKIGLVVNASSASVNREIEKQNDLMLTQIMNKHYQTIGQLVQAVQNVSSSPAVKDYFTHVIDSSNKLMRSILRNFGKDDVDILIPEVDLDAGRSQGAPANGNGPTLVPPVQSPAAPGIGGLPSSAGMAQGLAGFGLPTGTQGQGPSGGTPGAG